MGLLSGLEDFEDKIDKIASGVDQDENSWINQIYNKLSDAANENPDDYEESDGLEPPMLDETWGLKDGDEATENEVKTKRSVKDDTFRKELEEIYDGDSSCRSKLWTCMSKVAMGGLSYVNTEDGITG